MENVEKIPQNKRYYWLKLPNNYFSRLEQKKMKKQEHGKDIQIIYLRMMLLSIDKEGCIYYQGVYDTIEEELAEEFDEPVEIIKKTLNYLKDNNMISIDEKSDCFVPESLNLTGSECASAERVRRHRENQKALQSNTNVTSGNGCVTLCNVELEKEIEKEIKKEIKKESALCSELEESAPNLSGIKLPLIDKTLYEIPLDKITIWKDAYPAVDVEQEFKKMIAWLEANPKRRKTKRGIDTFINTWLSREQDKGGRYRNGEHKQENSVEAALAKHRYNGKVPDCPDGPFQ